MNLQPVTLSCLLLGLLQSHSSYRSAGTALWEADGGYAFSSDSAGQMYQASRRHQWMFECSNQRVKFRGKKKKTKELNSQQPSLNGRCWLLLF